MSSEPPTDIRPPAARDLPADVWLEVTHQLDAGRARPRHVRSFIAAAAAVVVVAVGIGGATLMRPHVTPGVPASTSATSSSPLASASPTQGPSSASTTPTPSSPPSPAFTGSPEATEVFAGWTIAYYRDDSQSGYSWSRDPATMTVLVTFAGSLDAAKAIIHQDLLAPAYTPPSYAPLTGTALLDACVTFLKGTAGQWSLRLTSPDTQTIVIENAAHVAYACDGFGGTLTVSKAGTGTSSRFYVATMSGLFADGDHGLRVVGFGPTSSSLAGVTYAFENGTAVEAVVGSGYWLLTTNLPNGAMDEESPVTVTAMAPDGRRSTSTFTVGVDTVCQQINHGC